MAWQSTYRQAAGDTGLTPAPTFTNAFLIGSLVVVAIRVGSSIAPTVSDNGAGGGNTYSLVANNNEASTCYSYIYATIVNKSGATVITVSTGGGVSTPCVAAEWIGAPSTLQVDKTATDPEGSRTTLVTPASITPSRADTLAIAMIGAANAFGSSPPTNTAGSFTTVNPWEPTNTNCLVFMAYRVNPPASALTPNWSWINSRNVCEVLANFKTGNRTGFTPYEGIVG